jgi:anti-sigma B factor antagonist
VISASPSAPRFENLVTGIHPAAFAGAGASAATIVHLSGEIDIFTSTALRRQLLNALRHSTKLLILDLSQVSFCDSSGLAVLVGIQQRARARGILSPWPIHARTPPMSCASPAWTARGVSLQVWK